MEDRKITWSKTALGQFGAAINYIAADSLYNAEKVENDILGKIGKLGAYPEIYSRDKFKLNNDGSYRAFEIHHYRIAYRVKVNEVLIVRIRHTSRDPLYY
jgi:plasmid stabilization system protein ParE